MSSISAFGLGSRLARTYPNSRNKRRDPAAERDELALRPVPFDWAAFTPAVVRSVASPIKPPVDLVALAFDDADGHQVRLRLPADSARFLADEIYRRLAIGRALPRDPAQAENGHA